MRTSGKTRARTRTSRAVRTPALLAALVGASVLVAGIAAFASTHGGGADGTPTTAGRAAAVTGTSQGQSGGGGQAGPGAGAGRDGKVTHARKPILTAPAQPPVTRGAKWLTGAAGRLLSAVNADMGKISADQRTGDDGAARSAGAKLAADARAALDGPMPPADAAIYRSALTDFEQIGADTARGDFPAAGSLLARATLGIMTVTAAADPPAPANPVANG